MGQWVKDLVSLLWLWLLLWCWFDPGPGGLLHVASVAKKKRGVGTQNNLIFWMLHICGLLSPGLVKHVRG